MRLADVFWLYSSAEKSYYYFKIIYEVSSDSIDINLLRVPFKNIVELLLKKDGRVGKWRVCSALHCKLMRILNMKNSYCLMQYRNNRFIYDNYQGIQVNWFENAFQKLSFLVYSMI